jgi:hypothetical protein
MDEMTDEQATEFLRLTRTIAGQLGLPVPPPGASVLEFAVVIGRIHEKATEHPRFRQATLAMLRVLAGEDAAPAPSADPAPASTSACSRSGGRQ